MGHNDRFVKMWVHVYVLGQDISAWGIDLGEKFENT